MILCMLAVLIATDSLISARLPETVCPFSSELYYMTNRHTCHWQDEEGKQTMQNRIRERSSVFFRRSSARRTVKVTIYYAVVCGINDDLFLRSHLAQHCCRSVFYEPIKHRWYTPDSWLISTGISPFTCDKNDSTLSTLFEFVHLTSLLPLTRCLSLLNMPHQCSGIATLYFASELHIPV